MPEPAVSPSPAPSAPPPAARSPDPGVILGSNPTISEPQRRWVEERSRIESADVWQQSPEKVALVKDVNGKVSAVPRNGADGASDQQPKPDDQPPVGDASVEAGMLKVGDLTLSPDEVKGLLERHALESSRKATAPTRAEDFKLELPADFKMPEGLTFQIDPNNSAIEPARQFALRHGLNQSQFSEMIGLYAASQAKEMVAFNSAKQAEVTKLGDAANARVDAVRGWLKSMGGNHFGALCRVLELAPVADTVVGLEHLMHRYVTQGGASFSGAHREPHTPGKVSDETYQSMSYAQKLDYASKFDQSRR
jgi:hypothetical protein